MKTYHILPAINNIDFAGRLTSDAVINEKGNRAEFSLARTFGGDAGAAFLNNLVLFGTKKNPLPLELLKKGTAVVISARFEPANYTNKEGKEVKQTRIMVKTIKAAELVEKQYESEQTPADEEPINLEIEDNQ